MSDFFVLRMLKGGVESFVHMDDYGELTRAKYPHDAYCGDRDAMMELADEAREEFDIKSSRDKMQLVGIEVALTTVEEI